MYVNEYHDNHMEVDYVSAHSNHELGAKEMPYLPLPSVIVLSLVIPNSQKSEGKRSRIKSYTQME